MQLRDQLEHHGDWLFRHRSVLPLLLAPVLVAALSDLGDRHSRAAPPAIDVVAGGLAVLGLLVRGCVAGFVPPGTSGRNVRRQRADILNTAGPYSLVRHPLYVGNFLVVLGWTLASGSLWLVSVTALLFVVYYERIALREEAFLLGRFGPLFADWAARTPACIPRRWRWTPPGRAFRWGALVRREYQTACLVIAGFVAVHLLRAVFIAADVAAAPLWLSVGIADLTAFVLVWLSIRWRRGYRHIPSVASGKV